VIPVDVNRCSYCFQPKGQLHHRFCTRPGLQAEIAAVQKRVLYAATRCRECGMILVDGRCPTDWCPSNATERKAVEAGASIGTAIGWLIKLLGWEILITIMWLVYRAWTGAL